MELLAITAFTRRALGSNTGTAILALQRGTVSIEWGGKFLKGPMWRTPDTEPALRSLSCSPLICWIFSTEICLAPLRGQDALATAGETPALQVPVKKVLYAGRGPSTAQRIREATPLLRSGW